MEHGVREPVLVIKDGDTLILLDGYKRARCAKRLNIRTLPSTILDNHVVPGIVGFIRLSCQKGLTSIEQACLVDELNQKHGLSMSEIAVRLGRWPAWVSVRLGILKDMSDVVREKTMTGQFPLHNYMYSLAPFKRLKSVKKMEIESFVRTVSNQGLSTRDIDRLAKGYFKGPAALKEQIQEGKLDWTLRQLKQQEKEEALPDEGLLDFESKALSQLNWTLGCVARLPGLLTDTRFESPSFFTKARKITGDILKMKEMLLTSLRRFYDTSR